MLRAELRGTCPVTRDVAGDERPLRLRENEEMQRTDASHAGGTTTACVHVMRLPCLTAGLAAVMTFACSSEGVDEQTADAAGATSARREVTLCFSGATS